MFRRRITDFCERAAHANNPAAPTAETKAALEPDQAVYRPLGDAIETATELMQQYGLTGWRVKLDHARRRAGQCDYNTKVISLSRLYVRNADKAHIRDTILHEIAHALVGPHHGHDAVWRQKAREIGCTATRCHTLSFSRARWIMQCPNGCFSIERHRRKSGLVCAKCKTAVSFIPGETALNGKAATCSDAE